MKYQLIGFEMKGDILTTLQYFNKSYGGILPNILTNV